MTHLYTKNTSYILDVLKSGHLSLVYYGRRIREREDYSALAEKYGTPYGSMVAYSRDDAMFGLDDACLECSSYGRGDFREACVEIEMENGSNTADFTFVSHSVLSDKPPIQGLPSSYNALSNLETHLFELADQSLGLTLKLFYTVFYDCDVICRRMEIINRSGGKVKLKRAMSMQLDLKRTDYTLLTFTGVWANERQKQEKPLSTGIYVNDSKTGLSSARMNPFIMLRQNEATEHAGEVYAVNLVYSGNHAEIVELTHFGKTRVLTGINPATFSWTLENGESFSTPEAVMTFSDEGLNGASQHMHRFVNKHIVRGFWKNKERPILINTWEGCYFDFNEHKLLSMAKQAAKLGVELFVLDDGWFAERRDDTLALGDWTVNKKKLPHGLDGLQKKLKALGLDFGLWVEPEMVNENSELYRAHPNWAVKLPNREPALGRNQLVLDLTNEEVCRYLIETLSAVFSNADISYVKWDCNRNFSDMYTSTLPPDRQGEFFHRYTLGLYEVLKALTERFPSILFESCASGGNRFDLGMLCYMPQTWASDNTDPLSRLFIQEGTSYGYPQSTIGAHVSQSPHSSTLRSTSIETRFNVAAFGAFGYELDPTELSPFDKNCIKLQIDFYKSHRKLFQFGTFYRMESAFINNRPIWAVVSADGREALAGFYQVNAIPAHAHDVLRVNGLDPDALFEVKNRTQYISVKSFGSLINHISPIKLSGEGIPLALIARRYMFAANPERYLIGGDALSYCGIALMQQFASTGYNENVRVLGDGGSRLYHIKAVD
ncbi:MAG TPA: alpha-galactosidase [Clostridia bacterium]|nr:alpha-galactosidase [Clostridia bacterium]